MFSILFVWTSEYIYLMVYYEYLDRSLYRVCGKGDYKPLPHTQWYLTLAFDDFFQPNNRNNLKNWYHKKDMHTHIESFRCHNSTLQQLHFFRYYSKLEKLKISYTILEITKIKYEIWWWFFNESLNIRLVEYPTFMYLVKYYYDCGDTHNPF